MNFNFFKKLCTAKRLLITFLSLLVVFIVSLLIYGYDSMHDPEKVKARLYACGKFGDQHMLIDKKYLSFGGLEYEGIQYWDKGAMDLHKAKGCDDQISRATFNIKWPEMSPSGGYRLDSKRLYDITFMLGLIGSWPPEWGNNKDFRDQTEILLNEVNDSNVTDFKITYEEINKNKVFNKDLDLYEVVYSRGGEKIAKHVYWQEVEGKGVGIVIGCQNMFSGEVECDLASHVPDYGFNTSYLWISFHGELLPYWKQLQRDSLKLIKSFKVGERLNESSKRNE